MLLINGINDRSLKKIINFLNFSNFKFYYCYFYYLYFIIYSFFDFCLFCLILMLYISFGKVLEILRSFTTPLGLHIDIRFFICHTKFQIYSQSLHQEALIFITNQQNALKLENVRKVIAYLSAL